MNFFLAKHSHHLLGLPSSLEKTRSHTRMPVSCRSCCKYWRIKSRDQAEPINLEFIHSICSSNKRTTIGRRRGFRIDGVQRKASIAGYIEFGNGQTIHLLQTLILVAAALQSFQALGDVQRYVDEHPIDLGLQIMWRIKHNFRFDFGCWREVQHG